MYMERHVLRGVQLVLLIAALLICKVFENSGSFLPLGFVFLIGIVVCVLEYRFNRCPHCGKYLWKNHGDYCQYCGNPL